MLTITKFAATSILALSSLTTAPTTKKVIDIPTRPGVMQRMIVLTPPDPKAAVVLLPGGHGGLQVSPKPDEPEPNK